MTAEAIATALGGRKAGHGWMARCPAHDDREPSLSLRDADGRVLVHCHAGCDQRAVISALCERGLWGSAQAHPPMVHVRAGSAAAPDTSPRDSDRRAAARSIWRASAPVAGTPVEAYLASRGLTVPLPSALRFHGALKHPSGGRWPCMVALVTRGLEAEPVGIHRTFLAPDGTGKAPVSPTKMMLGPCGGGAVRLADTTDAVMVGEGVETCLSVMQATGRPAWAALSTSGLRALDLPIAVREVIVLADGDDAGDAAARDCARRWKREGRRVRIARPPRGLDFNDLLMSGAHRARGSAA